MTALGFLVGSLRLAGLLGLALLVVGAWQGLEAFSFAQEAKVREGTFLGYAAVERLERLRSTSGPNRDVRVTAYHPMFAWRDAAGAEHRAQEDAPHLVPWLDTGQAVQILVPPGRPEAARLAHPASLYGGGAVAALFGVLLFALPWLGARRLEGWASAESGAGTGLRAALLKPLPLGGLLGVLGWLLVLGGAAAVPVFLLIRADEARLAEEARLESEPAGSPPVEEPSLSTGATAAGEPARTPAPRERPGERLAAELRRAPREVHPLEAAARRYDLEEVRRLLDEGQSAKGFSPAVVKTLVARGEVELVRALADGGFDLDQRYARQTFGDQALWRGDEAMVRLIRDRGGRFEAPPAFVALVAGDIDALRVALRGSPVEPRFRGSTLARFAERHRLTHRLEAARR